ncbi:DUF2505 domain-containing protein [Amycolatopsis sp. FDAARGOS 1241]|uniref:DUF2505 domain-containing protein n=1 Tax=Amycolatopsis sp. FDAARGOS 1241 TaxID=2778070 RepID=UPI00194EEEA6|nr:DUF2505 domain-containing protein [Amycolatopsis sp. FDAARGOS 1241]QRP45544.1 DUF2505 domain-containing protein [Amycolatopsis sp. FDAARGOS 1241]
MGSRIEHRAEFSAPLAAVLAAVSGEDALRARLAELGGDDAKLLSHSVDGDTVRYELQHGIAAQRLPQAVRALHKGDIIVRRKQVWQRSGDGHAGHVDVNVSGMPGEIGARTFLTPRGQRVEFRTSGEVTVRIPLFGGKIEEFVAQQVTNLLSREADFTTTWLAEHA